MGTSGLYGFVIDGEVKATYNHYDSYPSGLGQDLVDLIKSDVIKKKKVRALKMVDGESTPTEEEKETLAKYADTNVSTGSLDEWYVLLRRTQGIPMLNLQSGYMIDGLNFAKNSLHCEWGYLINLDDKTLEVYRGFNTSGKVEGRFKDLEPLRENDNPIINKYYPITLLGTFKFKDLDNFAERVKDLRVLNSLKETRKAFKDDKIKFQDYIWDLEELLERKGIDVYNLDD